MLQHSGHIISYSPLYKLRELSLVRLKYQTILTISLSPHHITSTHTSHMSSHDGLHYACQLAYLPAVLCLKIYYRPPQLTLHRQAHLRPTREARKVRSSSPPAYAIFKLQAASHPKLRTRLRASPLTSPLTRTRTRLLLRLRACNPMSKDILALTHSLRVLSLVLSPVLSPVQYCKFA